MSTLLFMTAVRWSIGPALGLGFVPLFVAPIVAAYVPFRGWRIFSLNVLLIALAAAVPLIGIDSFFNWLQIQSLLIATTFASGFAVTALLPSPPSVRGGGAEAAFASSAVILIWLAWLTWPIWLANAWWPSLDHLLDVQPLNAVGSVLIDLGDWTHQPIAYKFLLGLGQDVPYEPARSAWPAIALHSGVAIGAAIVLKWRLSRRPAAGG